MNQPISVYNAQYKFREVKSLVERLQTGQRLLDDEIQKGSIAKCAEIIHHFNNLSEQLLNKTEELILIQQFAINGTKAFIRRNGQLKEAKELTDELIELTPQKLLMLEKLKDVFGEVPNDILEIVD
jgi:hypothetical protein